MLNHKSFPYPTQALFIIIKMMMNAALLRGASRPMLRTCSVRQFSLLVPLQVKANLPAELQNSPLTDRYFNDLKAEYAKFNANC